MMTSVRRGTLRAPDELSLREALPARASHAVERAALRGAPVLLSISIPARAVDPVALFASARNRGDDSVLWDQPSEAITLVGLGALAPLAAAGPTRFTAISRAWRELTDQAVSLTLPALDDDLGPPPGAPLDPVTRSASSPAPGPILLGGFAFDDGGATGRWADFGDAWLALPRVLYGARRGGAWITVNTLVTAEDDPTTVSASICQQLRSTYAELGQFDADPDTATELGLAPSPCCARPTLEEDPAAESWLPAITRTASAIRAGNLEKAVLARSVRLTTPGGFDPAPALRYLQKHFPECYIFAISRGAASPGATFLGATPERIVRRAGDAIQVTSLAGSTPRGSTPAEDQHRADALLGDPKNRLEHRLVLDSILEALAPVAEEIDAAPEPAIRKLANVQHLYTPITARVAPEAEILDLVGRIHPTPAICGHPTPAALELIAAEEPFDRGWYAGPIGWLDARGQGEFVVGLRSALLHGDEATLYAGCGIMGDSDPQAEYDESNLKLRPMLDALAVARRPDR